MRVNGSLLKSDILSKISKELLICTSAATLEGEKSNSSSFYEAVTHKFCTEFKGGTLESVCIELKESFYSISNV